MTWTLNFRRCFSVFDRISTRALSDASKLDMNLIISFLSQDSKSLISCWFRSKRYSELVISFQYLVNSSCNVTSAWLFCLIRVVMTSLNSSSVRFFKRSVNLVRELWCLQISPEKQRNLLRISAMPLKWVQWKNAHY